MVNIDFNSSVLEIYDNLMQKRILKVLLICSSYDAFILEEDGRIEELIFKEYTSLNLRYPPYFVIVPTAKEAFEELNKNDVGLIIAMPSITDDDVFKFSKSVKNKYPTIPFVLLTPFSRDISLRIEKENMQHIDYIFSWLGNTDILLAIVKLVEDALNADTDFSFGVQFILLVEDSIRYYSSFLPQMYKMLLSHNPDIEANTLNEHHKMVRKRGRPKVMLANSYDKATEIITKYSKNMLGVISDVRFPKNGKIEPKAGFLLADFIKYMKLEVPIVFQSSEIENKEIAESRKIGFFDKNSPDLLHRLRGFMRKYLALGDFVFIDPCSKEEIMKAKDLYSLQKIIFDIPDKSLTYHLKRNHLSRWLNARAIFNLGNFLREYSIDQFKDLNEIRYFIRKSINEFLLTESRGVIARFNTENYDEFISFAQIGDGVIGGKARGILFLDMMISNYKLEKKWQNVDVSTPRTVVIGSGVFDEFMEQNKLYEFVFDNKTDEQIVNRFIEAEFPAKYLPEIELLISFFRSAVAVRSSSLLEDSYYQPYAGIYSTYMLPFKDNLQNNLQMLIKAIKCVWASVFFEESKSYSKVTQNMLDEEKMAVIIQPICGRQRNGKFYPILSGVAKSYNYYPIGIEKTEDGIAEIALGLGKQIVEGSTSLRFSPKATDRIMQLSETHIALTDTQKDFYAMDMTLDNFTPSADEKVTLKKYTLKDAEKDNSIDFISSTYNYQNDMIYDGNFYEGKKILTFNNILKYNKIPLADILNTILKMGQEAMGHPVEIEFAMDFDFKQSQNVNFRLLQIRPIVEVKEIVNIKNEEIKNDDCVVVSYSALGNGIIEDIFDIVYVKPETFDSVYNPDIKEIIAKINDEIDKLGRNYILIGPGRWGSRDRWLGIPVKWSNISAARIIIEAGLPNYVIEPSQGTHFFHNITALRVGYFNVNPHLKDGFYDIEYLNSFDAVYEDNFIRWIQSPSPFKIKIDGKKRIGLILKK